MHLNLIQVAESLGVEEAVVMAWVRHDGLPCVRDSARLLFDRSEVAGWATERGMAARAGFLASTAAAENVLGRLDMETMLRRGRIWRGIAAADVPATLARILENFSGVAPPVRRMLAKRVQSPGAITWAPIGRGIALPHLRSRAVLGRDNGLIALVLLDNDLLAAEEPPDRQPIRRLLFFIAPTPRAHLETLANICAALNGRFGEAVCKSEPDSSIFDALGGRPSLPGKETL